MTYKLTCQIPYAIPSYDIDIRNGLLHEHAELSSYLKNIASRFVIISSGATIGMHAELLLKALKGHGLDVRLFSFPDGEMHKTRQNKEQLENELLRNYYGRDTCLIALGGGVVTDLVGYLAATYCRGVPLVSIPTTLLAMVDASIGGKTGVNVPEGKNMIGCVYQPMKVWIDPLTLSTLPAQEIRNGCVEMIKHGLIADSSYFEFLENNHKQLLSLDPKILSRAIYESCRIKYNIVKEDPFEKGKRRLLNFGHTVGHALEKISKYSMPHGEAVALGLVAESHLSQQMGLSKATVNRTRNILMNYGLPLKLNSHMTPATIKEAMIMDKKSKNGIPRFVILKDVGSPCTFEEDYCSSVSEEHLENTLQGLANDLCRH